MESRWRSWECGVEGLLTVHQSRVLGISVAFLFAGSRVAGLRLVYVTLCHESSSANT